jgi:hypothetical protein
LLMYKLKNIPGSAKPEEHYWGYSFHMRVNLRWVDIDTNVKPYSARVWKEDSVLFRLPAFPYTVVHNSEQVVKDLPGHVTNAVNSVLHLYDNDKDNCQWRYLLLQFPAGQTLSSKLIFAEAGEDEVDTTPKKQYKPACRRLGTLLGSSQ